MIDQMILNTLAHEGGYVDHPADRGGPTNYGVTLATLRRERDDQTLTASDVQRLTLEEAKAIYKRSYYLRPGIDQLPVRIQPFIFDCAINHGPRRAVRFVQAVCSAAGFDPGPIDGIMGPATRRAAADAQEAMGDAFLAALVEERMNFFRTIVRHDASQEVFLRGWLSRARSFLAREAA